MPPVTRSSVNPWSRLDVSPASLSRLERRDGLWSQITRGEAIFIGGERNLERHALRTLALTSGDVLETPIHTVDVSSSGRWLVAGLENGELLLWTLSDGTLWDCCSIQGPNGTSSVPQVAFAPNEQYLLVGSDVSAAQVLRVNEPVPRSRVFGAGPWLQVQGADTSVPTVAWSSDSRWIVGAGNRATITIWDAQQGFEPIRTFRLVDPTEAMAPPSFLHELAFSPDMNFLIAAGNGRIRAWNLSNGSLVCHKESWGDMACVRMSPVAPAHFFSCVKHVVDFRGAASDVPTLRYGLDRDIEPTDVSFPPNGSDIVYAAGTLNVMLQTKHNSHLAKIKRYHSAERGYSICTVAYSGNSKLIATGKTNGTIELWSRYSMTVIAVLYSHTGRISMLRFVDNDRRLVSLSPGQQDGTVRVWNVESIGKQAVKYEKELAGDLAFLPTCGL